MAIANNSEGSSVPQEMTQHLEMEDDNKLTQSADYNSTAGRNIFRNKKFTKKRHEPKARKTMEGQDPSTVTLSDEEDEDPKSPSVVSSDSFHRSIPKMMKSINQTIKKMTIKDNNGSGGNSGVLEGTGALVGVGGSALEPSTSTGSTGRTRKGTGCGINEPFNSIANPNPPPHAESSQENKYERYCGNPNCRDNCMFADGGGKLLAALEKLDQEEMERGGPVDEDEDIDIDATSNQAEGAVGGMDEATGAGGVVQGQSGQVPMSQCNSNNGPTQPQPHALGKRRRHRRKQQYKRMAVDVQSEKKPLKLKKVPHSNSSEDSGIGKRKRNIILSDNATSSTATADAILKATTSAGIVPVPVRAVVAGSHDHTSAGHQLEQWKLDQDSDAIMMDYDDMESNSTRIPQSHSHITEEESGESDTQNDDIESLSDHNQDADDEESDYYNNDSSTTSLSESSFTILNPSKKFIPVHSREIRSGRRRLKNTTLPPIENEELSKFLQSPVESTLKVYASSEKERQEFMNVASVYSLSYEECHDQEDDQRMMVQFTKTPKTNSSTQQQQRRNAEMIKAAAGERSSFTAFSEGSLAPLFDILVQETRDSREINDECIDDRESNGPGNNLVGVNQLVNSKRIKKGC